MFKKSGAWELLEDIFCFLDEVMFEIIDEMRETEVRRVVKPESQKE